MKSETTDKYVVAVDSFKGCMTSAEAESAVAEALKEALGEVAIVCIPMSDGGEGMLEAFTEALGGSIVTTTVHDPLMRRIEASYGITPGGTAVIETARACGLTLMRADELNPMRATTYGVGELVAAAVRRGCRRFLIGLGGSGTSDAGIGMMRALTDILAPRGGSIDDALKGALGQCGFTLACDVDNPLCGSDGAAAVFGPQKGATADMVRQLDDRAGRFARISAAHCGQDCSAAAGAGAAGGLGYAFMQFLNAEKRNGADLMLDISGFDTATEDARLVITGEGHADRQTLMGKLPMRVMARAAGKGIPTWLLAGKTDAADSLVKAGFARVTAITPDGADMAEAMRKDVAKENIKAAVTREISRM